MNLPDFLLHTGLNDLREEMGAELITINRDLEWERLIIQLQHEGIDVSIDDVEITDDKTFEYKGQKVIVYIRDQSASILASGKGYKFHLAHCATLEKMSQEGRYHRYVVTTRDDGKFLVNIIESGRDPLESLQSMRVCINCIRTLHLFTTPANFDLKVFFEKYSSRITKTPKHTDISAPLNDYPADWDRISRQQREIKNWTCQDCSFNLNEHKELLHVHHIDGEKSNNHPTNLRVLCVVCHGDQPAHEKLQSTPDYKLCKRLKGAKRHGSFIAKCGNCGTHNRVTSHLNILEPICGNCKNPVQVPEYA